MAIPRKYETVLGKKEMLCVNNWTLVFAKRSSSGDLE